MRKGKVYVESYFASVITETPEGYVFEYDSEYLQRADALPVSITLPLQHEC